MTQTNIISEVLRVLFLMQEGEGRLKDVKEKLLLIEKWGFMVGLADRTRLMYAWCKYIARELTVESIGRKKNKKKGSVSG